jgi:hypothetical protein
MIRILVFAFVLVGLPQYAVAEEKWATTVRTTPQWSAFPCSDYWITVACGIVKDYKDPGSLPQVVRVGDTIQYPDRDGKTHEFAVKAIKFYRYDEDVDFTWGGERYTARKGETHCSLYDSEKARRSEDYQSKLVVKGCELIQ